MSFFEKKYEINGWRGKKYRLTAKELYERVLDDSKSNYNWIASATELVRICRETDFPEKYVASIKAIILNCFADLERKKEYGSHGEPTDPQAVYYCYNSLSGTDKKVKEIKEKYLKAVIVAIVKYTKEEVRFPIHRGDNYRKICKEWEKEKFEEWSSKEEIDFCQLKEYLYDDFEKTIKKAEEEGTFVEEDERKRKWEREFLEAFDLKEVDFYM